MDGRLESGERECGGEKSGHPFGVGMRIVVGGPGRVGDEIVETKAVRGVPAREWSGGTDAHGGRLWLGFK